MSQVKRSLLCSAPPLASRLRTRRLRACRGRAGTRALFLEGLPASSCHACSGLFTKRKSSLWIIACQQLEPGDLQPYDCNFVPRSCTRTSGTWPQYHTVIGWSNQPDVLVTCPRRPTFHTTRTVRDRIDRTLTVTVQRSSSDFAWSALLSYTRTAGRQRTCTSNHASCTAERARRPGLHSVLFAGFAVAGGCRSSPWHFTSNASQPAVCVRTARGHQRCAGRPLIGAFRCPGR